MNGYVEWAGGVAREAGALLLRYYERRVRVEYKAGKGDVDVVTEADRASEAFIIERLKARFPDHAILAEEGGGREMASPYRWYIDPLDGTTNFAHAYPHFAISVGLVERGELRFGLVHNPIRQETFVAHRGGGAFLNGSPIQVSSVDSLDRALLATGFPYDRREKTDFYLGFVGDFLRRIQGLRREGTASLDLCYVACGRVDGFWEMKLNPWDTSAGALIVREAGGQVTDFRGGQFDPHGSETVASNGKIHAAMVAILTERSKR